MKPRPELVLVGVTVLWGSTFVVTKSLVRVAPPLVYLAARFCLGALVMVALTWRRRPKRHGERRALVDGAVLGLLNSAGLILQVYGQLYTTASKSAFVTSLNTPLTPLAGWLLYRMRPSRPQLAAVAIATLGLLLLTYPEGGARWNRGDLLTVGCALLYAFTIVEIARRTPHHDALHLTTIQVCTAGACFAVLALGAHALLAVVPPGALPLLQIEARPIPWTLVPLAQVAYMAVVCTAVTFAGQTWAMARMTATHAAIVFALEPVFATLLAISFEGSEEWPGGRGSIGAALVLVAVAVSEIRRPRRRAVE